MTAHRSKKGRSARKPTASIPAPARKAVNEAAIRQFFAAWDPSWRWVLILGLRDLRANAERLGSLAASESPPGTCWDDDTYVYGPLTHGLTAAAVNEATQHCEDLFAVLKFLREPLEFVQQMMDYSAGKVSEFGRQLKNTSNETIRRLFIVPSASIVTVGLTDANDPPGAAAVVEEGVVRLAELVRGISDWYSTYESFHVQYKHGLKLAMRPYGNPTPEAIEERRGNLKGSLMAFTSEPISAMLKRPQQQQGMIFPNLIPEAQAYIAELVNERALLRYQMSGPDVDLDDVVTVSANVAQLLRIAAVNRLAISEGVNADGNYKFQLPGSKAFEVIDVVLALSSPLLLEQFRS